MYGEKLGDIRKIGKEKRPEIQKSMHFLGDFRVNFPGGPAGKAEHDFPVVLLLDRDTADSFATQGVITDPIPNP